MTQVRGYSRKDLTSLSPRHDTFVGIDSDGCVFDTMEIKQKKCFHGLIISHWGLQLVAKYVRETAEFVNLYSRWRGQNRFITLVKLFELLEERPEVVKSGVNIPRFPSLRRLIDSGAPLGNPALEKAVKECGDKELASLLSWSNAINRSIADTVKKVPPYEWCLRSLKRIVENSDAICVSQTPEEALVREWSENGLVGYVRAIAGQELGTKTEHIAMATRGRYAPGRILMIGDAPGDMRAARENSALFYPINPAGEEKSWERFHDEAYDRFLNGDYAGSYEDRVVAEFEALLPETPPWRN